MSEAERHLLAIGCPKVNLQVRASNADAMQFYERIGFSADDVVSFGNGSSRIPRPERKRFRGTA